jgi:hypothetical protein
MVAWPHVFGKNIMAREWLTEESLHFNVGRKQAVRLTGRGQGKIWPQRCTPSDYFQLGPFSCSFPPPNNAVIKGLINPLTKSEPSVSNDFPKAHQLATKPQYMSL